MLDKKEYDMQKFHCKKHTKIKRGFNFCYDCIIMASLEWKIKRLTKC